MIPTFGHHEKRFEGNNPNNKDVLARGVIGDEADGDRVRGAVGV